MFFRFLFDIAKPPVRDALGAFFLLRGTSDGIAGNGGARGLRPFYLFTFLPFYLFTAPLITNQA